MCPPAVCAAGVFRFFADGFCLLQGDAPASAKSPRNTRIYYGRKLNSIARKGQGATPLENLQIPLAKRGKCGYNEWECARMGTAQDKPWKASRGGCEPGQDCLMANHPGARFSEAMRAEWTQVRRSGQGKTGSPVIEKAGACACTERIGIVPVKLGGTADESQKAFSSVPVHFHAGADFLFAPQQRQQK